MNTLAKEILVIISVVFISVLCELFPTIFHYEYFILYYLLRLMAKEIWGE